MSDDKVSTEDKGDKGAVEEQNEKIDAIVGDEALGYEGSGRGEHSGQNQPRDETSQKDRLADNRPDQVK